MSSQSLTLSEWLSTATLTLIPTAGILFATSSTWSGMVGMESLATSTSGSWCYFLGGADLTASALPCFFFPPWNSSSTTSLCTIGYTSSAIGWASSSTLALVSDYTYGADTSFSLSESWFGSYPTNLLRSK